MSERKDWKIDFGLLECEKLRKLLIWFDNATWQIKIVRRALSSLIAEYEFIFLNK